MRFQETPHVGPAFAVLDPSDHIVEQRYRPGSSPLVADHQVSGRLNPAEKNWLIIISIQILHLRIFHLQEYLHTDL